MMKLGERIRTIRESRGISLRKLAREISVSASFISQVEQDKANPSVDSLQKIAGILGVSTSYILQEDTSSAPVEIRSKNKNEFNESLLEGVILKNLAPYDEKRNMSPVLLTVKPNGGSIVTLSHLSGEEFILVLSGSVELNIGSNSYTLSEGDNIYFESSIKHSFRNNSAEVAKLLWVKTTNF